MAPGCRRDVFGSNVRLPRPPPPPFIGAAIQRTDRSGSFFLFGPCMGTPGSGGLGCGGVRGRGGRNTINYNVSIDFIVLIT